MDIARSLAGSVPTSTGNRSRNCSHARQLLGSDERSGPMTLCQKLAALVLGFSVATAAAQNFCLRLGAPGSFETWDQTSGDPVPVTFSSADPGGSVIIESIATQLTVRGTPGLPAALPIGARNVTAIQMTVRHPGGVDEAAIRADSLRVRFRDESGTPLVPGTLIDALAIMPAVFLAVALGIFSYVTGH